MRRDSLKMRGDRPFLLMSLRQGDGAEELTKWVRQQFESRRKTS
jgi:urease accessory protein